MNNKILPFFLLFSVLTGCKKEIPLIFSSETFTEESLDICRNVACPEITINYVEAIGTTEVSERINKRIQKFIIESLNFDEEASKAKNFTEASEVFIKTYRLHSAEFPDMAAEYFAQINVSENYSSETLISIELKNYLYTGGAHGYGSTTFLNIDPQTGDTFPSEAIIKNIDDFTNFAEKKFKEENSIPQNDPVNSTGFWFEDDTFYLPETLGFTRDSIILLYNQYDIASYAAGPIEVKISLEDAKDFLTFELPFN